LKQHRTSYATSWCWKHFTRFICFFFVCPPFDLLLQRTDRHCFSFYKFFEWILSSPWKQYFKVNGGDERNRSLHVVIVFFFTRKHLIILDHSLQIQFLIATAQLQINYCGRYYHYVLYSYPQTHSTIKK
jgi:hypothetical protein